MQGHSKLLFSNLSTFRLIWISQAFSILASQMTGFILTIWAYQISPDGQRATMMTLLQVFYNAPFLISSLFVGAIIDRYDRKKMMMVSDLTTGVATIIALVLYASGRLEVWHLFVTSFIAGVGNAFQWPAYSVAISILVPKEQLGRVNGMMSLLEAGPGILAPSLAGLIIGWVGAWFGGVSIMAFDIVTFIIAIGVLAVVEIQSPPSTPGEPQSILKTLVQDVTYGFRYIVNRPSLLGLLMIPLFANLFSGTAKAVLTPTFLARTNSNQVLWGFFQSASGIGGVVGGVIMSIWGGPKKRIHGVLGGWIIYGLMGVGLIGLNINPAFWFIGTFIGAVVSPIMFGSSQAIWQSKVAVEVQGRVFSIRRLIAWLSIPIFPLIAGPLSDSVLEPMMKSPTQTILSSVVGTGPGAGMALLFIFGGIATAMVGLMGYLYPLIRNVETLVPDHVNETTKAPVEA